MFDCSTLQSDGISSCHREFVRQTEVVRSGLAIIAYLQLAVGSYSHTFHVDGNVIRAVGVLENRHGACSVTCLSVGNADSLRIVYVCSIVNEGQFILLLSVDVNLAAVHIAFGYEETYIIIAVLQVVGAVDVARCKIERCAVSHLLGECSTHLHALSVDCEVVRALGYIRETALILS